MASAYEGVEALDTAVEYIEGAAAYSDDDNELAERSVIHVFILLGEQISDCITHTTFVGSMMLWTSNRWRQHQKAAVYAILHLKSRTRLRNVQPI